MTKQIMFHQQAKWHKTSFRDYRRKRFDMSCVQHRYWPCGTPV